MSPTWKFFVLLCFFFWQLFICTFSKTIIIYPRNKDFVVTQLNRENKEINTFFEHVVVTVKFGKNMIFFVQRGTASVV